MTQDASQGLKKQANLLYQRFVQRRDVKAVQEPSGAYHPVRSRFTLRDFQYHLDGATTYGHYLVDQEGKCRVTAFDIDFDEEYSWRGQILNPRKIFGTDHPAHPDMVATIRSIADGLAFRLERMYPDLTVMTAFSGSKGIHVYGAFQSPTTATAARGIAVDVLDSYGCFELARGKNFYTHSLRDVPITIEIFPKQEKVNKGGFGNLLKLPLGVNQKSSRRAFFYNPRDPLSHLNPYNSFDALQYGTLIKT